MIPLALTRLDVADFVEALFLVYIILIFLNILMQWFPRVPYNRVLYACMDFVRDTTNPYLRIFRRFVPSVGGGSFSLDLSPIVALIVLFIGQAVIVRLIEG